MAKRRREIRQDFPLTSPIPRFQPTDVGFEDGSFQCQMDWRATPIRSSLSMFPLKTGSKPGHKSERGVWPILYARFAD